MSTGQLVSLPDFWAINDCIIQVFLHRLDTEVTERSDHHWHAFAFALHLDQAPKKKIAGLEVFMTHLDEAIAVWKLDII